MSTPTQNQSLPRPRHQKRVIFASIGLLLLTVAAAIMILNALGITPLPNTWSNGLAIAFVTFGVIVAFGTWLLPLSSMSSTAELTFNSEHELEFFRQQIERSLNKRLGRGGLIIRVDENNVGQEVSVVSQMSWVRHPNTRDQLPDIQRRPVKREKVNNGYICLAVFRNLDPDDYVIWIVINQSTSIPVFSNEVTLVDLR